MNAEEFAKELVIGDQAFLPGERGVVQLPIGHLVNHELMNLTVHVRRGKEPGPRLFVCAALHGDEINGVEAVRRLLSRKMQSLRGDLIAVPVANLPAFLYRSRYLPDRRDLNRLFPGSSQGSFGARLARIISQEIVAKCTHGIDMHTGAVNRPNLPQIRYSPGSPESQGMALAFGAPVVIESAIREGSLRHTFAIAKKLVLTYEGGEAQILDPAPVRVGLRGIARVMQHLGMLGPYKVSRRATEPVVCEESWWERAPRGGIYTPAVELGAIVKKGSVLGKVGDPLGLTRTIIYSQRAGIVIGRTKNAVIDEGDGLFNIASPSSLKEAATSVEVTRSELDQDLDQAVFDAVDHD